MTDVKHSVEVIAKGCGASDDYGFDPRCALSVLVLTWIMHHLLPLNATQPDALSPRVVSPPQEVCIFYSRPLEYSGPRAKNITLHQKDLDTNIVSAIDELGHTSKLLT